LLESNISFSSYYAHYPVDGIANTPIQVKGTLRRGDIPPRGCLKAKEELKLYL
jgi:hypothetical protein